MAQFQDLFTMVRDEIRHNQGGSDRFDSGTIILARGKLSPAQDELSHAQSRLKLLTHCSRYTLA